MRSLIKCQLLHQLTPANKLYVHKLACSCIYFINRLCHTPKSTELINQYNNSILSPCTESSINTSTNQQLNHSTDSAQLTRSIQLLCQRQPVDICSIHELLNESIIHNVPLQYDIYPLIFTTLNKSSTDVSKLAFDLFRSLHSQRLVATHSICNNLIRVLCKFNTVKPSSIVDTVVHMLQYDRVQPSTEVVQLLLRNISAHTNLTSDTTTLHVLLGVIDEYSYSNRHHNHNVYIELNSTSFDILIQTININQPDRLMYLFNTILYGVYDVANYASMYLHNNIIPDKRTFQTLLLYLAQQADVKLWMKQLAHMSIYGISPTRQLFNNCLKQFARSLSINELHIPLQHMQQYNISIDIGTFNILLAVAQQTCNVQLAHDIIHIIHNTSNVQPNTVSYSILIDTISKSVIQHSKNTTSTNTATTQLYHKLNHLLDQMSIAYQELLHSGHEPDFIILTSMMNALRAVDYLPQFPAHQLTDNIQSAHQSITQQSTHKPDTFYYNTLISNAANNRDIQQCTVLYNELLQQHLLPDIYTFSILTRVYTQLTSVHDVELARQCLLQVQQYITTMQQLHIPVSSMIYARLLRVTTTLSLAEQRYKDVFKDIEQINNVMSANHVKNALSYNNTVLLILNQSLKMYKSQPWHQSLDPTYSVQCSRMLLQICNRTQADADSLNAVIEHYVLLEQAQPAVQTLKQMLDMSLQPTSSIYHSIIGLLIKRIQTNGSNPSTTDITVSQAVETLLFTIDSLIDSGYKLNTLSCNAMLIAMSRSSSITTKQLLSTFNQLLAEHNSLIDCSSYSIMLRTLATRRDTTNLNIILDIAISNSIRLDDSMFRSLLYAHSSTNDINKVVNTIAMMSQHNCSLTHDNVDMICKHVGKHKQLTSLLQRVRKQKSLSKPVIQYFEQQLHKSRN